MIHFFLFRTQDSRPKTDMDLAEKYRPWGVKVTDMSAQLWCEKQVEFSLTKPRIRTVEMKKGEDIHTDKEAELYEMIEVVPKTKEDKILMKLHNTMVALQGFNETGIAREIPVWGKFNSLKVVGIVDELKTEDGRLVVADTKTRKSPTLPRIAQSKPSRFQLMAYKELVDEISHGDYKPEDLLRHYGFTVDSAASPEFMAQHKEHGIDFEPNILKSATKAFSMFKEIPIIEMMRLSYEEQSSGKLIGKDEFPFDYEHFWAHCKFCEGFWRGERSSVPVSDYNSWKCSYCQYRDECDAVKKFAEIASVQKGPGSHQEYPQEYHQE